jgi:hypothetical protein
VESAKGLRNQNSEQIFDDREVKECKILQKIAVERVKNQLHALSSKFHSGRQYKKDKIKVQQSCQKSTKSNKIQ